MLNLLTILAVLLISAVPAGAGDMLDGSAAKQLFRAGTRR
jgi:hypothetical protein